MSYSSLAEFLEELSRCGQLARIEAEVDPQLELAEIARRSARRGGPALLFQRVRGSNVAVLANLLATEERVRRALAIESLDDVVARSAAWVQQNTPQNWFERLKMSSDDAGLNKFRPKTVKSGPSGQVVRLGSDVDLAALPLVKQWPGETGPSITAGVLIRQAPDGESRTAALCPMVALDANRLAIADSANSALAGHGGAAAEKQAVAVVLGGDPALLIAASVELPGGLDIYHAAGLLRGRGLDVVKCRTNDLEVPADADLIFEGYVDPDAATAAIDAAPAGTGQYQAISNAPVLNVTAITHRTHPILPAIIDCPRQDELAALAKVRERMLLPSLRAVAPQIVDVHLPTLGGANCFAFVAIRKKRPHDSRQVASALWGSPALRFTKFIVLVDDHVDVHDIPQVLAEIGSRAAPEGDLFHYDGPAHGGDELSSSHSTARRVGIDATRKIAGERPVEGHSARAASADVERLVSARWGEYKLDGK